MHVFATAAIATVLVVAPSSGVCGQDEEPLFGPTAPARVSGAWVHQDSVSEARIEPIGELMFEATGAIQVFEITSDDPRLAGTATATGAWVGWYPPALVAVVETGWRIEDDDGAWEGSSRRLASMADEDPVNVAEQVILDGSGAYEGLTAYLIIDSEEESFLGAIIPDEMPELPPDWMDVYESSAGDGAADDG